MAALRAASCAACHRRRRRHALASARSSRLLSSFPSTLSLPTLKPLADGGVLGQREPHRRAQLLRRGQARRRVPHHGLPPRARPGGAHRGARAAAGVLAAARLLSGCQQLRALRNSRGRLPAACRCSPCLASLCSRPRHPPTNQSLYRASPRLRPARAGAHRAHLQHLRPPHGAGRRPRRLQLCLAGRRGGRQGGLAGRAATQGCRLASDGCDCAAALCCACPGAALHRPRRRGAPYPWPPRRR